MSKILIMTDSACDISEAEEKELSIDILPFPIMLGGKSYISRVDFDNEQFYKLMSEHDEIPKKEHLFLSDIPSYIPALPVNGQFSAFHFPLTIQIPEDNPS